MSFHPDGPTPTPAVRIKKAENQTEEVLPYCPFPDLKTLNSRAIPLIASVSVYQFGISICSTHPCGAADLIQLFITG